MPYYKELTPTTLIAWLYTHYEYKLELEEAKQVLCQCELKYDDIFSEEELIQEVEDILINHDLLLL
jgi:hypothetical protein